MKTWVIILLGAAVGLALYEYKRRNSNVSYSQFSYEFAEKVI